MPCARRCAKPWNTPADIHTHLPPHSADCRSGAWMNCSQPLPDRGGGAGVAHDPARFYAKSKRKPISSGDPVHRTFPMRSPPGRAHRADRLGLDVGSRDLAAFRDAQQTVEGHRHGFRARHLESVVATNDPFDDASGLCGRAGCGQALPRRPAHRPGSTTARARAPQDGAIDETPAARFFETRRFLADWLKKTRALHGGLAAAGSYIPKIRLRSSPNVPWRRAQRAVRDMIGVKRAVNPP